MNEVELRTVPALTQRNHFLDHCEDNFLTDVDTRRILGYCLEQEGTSKSNHGVEVVRDADECCGKVAVHGNEVDRRPGRFHRQTGDVPELYGEGIFELVEPASEHVRAGI